MMKPNHAEAIAKIQLLRGDVAISVDLSWCILDDAALECLDGLPQLRELYLSHTEVTDAGLEHLKGLRQLQTLDLGGTNISDAGLEHLKDLLQLQTLDLSGAEVSDAGLERLKDLLQLQTLDLGGAKVTDAGLERLQALRQLQELGLSGTQVTDAGLRHLRGLPELEELCLWATGAGLKHLRGLPRLRELDLGGTQVTDAGLEHLKGLRQLQALGLSGTDVTNAGLEHLKGLEQLRTLDISLTRVKGPLDPAEWASQGPQFVGLDADPVPRRAAGPGRAEANEQLMPKNLSENPDGAMAGAGPENGPRTGPKINERRQAEEQSLKEQQYLHYLLELQDRDRQVVSCEIHDGFVQQLAAAIMHFAAFSRLKREGDGEVWESFETGLRALNDCMREARQLIRGLRLPLLDEFGVVAAVEDLVSQGSAQGKPEIDLVHNLDGERLAPWLENAVYRIIQEGLANARRYSQSERVLVRLTQRERCIRIEVQDWGIGFNPREVGEGHFGLEGIQKRASLFGGSATIESRVGRGTRIEVQLPLMRDEVRAKLGLDRL